MGGTDCAAEMSFNETCKVTCEDGFKAVGKYTCGYSAPLVTGISQCIDENADVVEEEREVVSGGFKVTVDLGDMPLTEFRDTLKKSIGESAGLTADDCVVTVTASRRLKGLLERRLAAVAYEIDYQLIIPEGVTSDSVFETAASIGTADSDVTASLTSALAAKGIQAEGFEVTKPAAQATATIVVNKDGGLVLPPEPDPIVQTTAKPPAPKAAAESEEEDDGAPVGAIIGGIVAVIAGFGICGAVYFFVVKKRNQQE